MALEPECFVVVAQGSSHGTLCCMFFSVSGGLWFGSGVELGGLSHGDIDAA